MDVKYIKLNSGDPEEVLIFVKKLNEIIEDFNLQDEIENFNFVESLLMDY